MKEIVEKATADQLRADLPELRIGDTVQVYVKITEGNRERVQMFEGTIISMKNGKRISRTFTVRRIASGVGVEKTFMYHSPSIEKIVVVRHGRVRRAKLYFLRDRVGKSARLKEKLS